MQLNIDLPEALLKRMKKDAVEMGVSLSDYTAETFQTFLSKPVASRRVYFEGKRKTMGRKIKV